MAWQPRKVWTSMPGIIKTLWPWQKFSSKCNRLLNIFCERENSIIKLEFFFFASIVFLLVCGGNLIPSTWCEYSDSWLKVQPGLLSVLLHAQVVDQRSAAGCHQKVQDVDNSLFLPKSKSCCCCQIDKNIEHVELHWD